MEKLLYMATLGCTKNLIDSEVMLGKLNTYRVVDDPTVADVIIVNTCGFIEAAKSESLHTIFQLHETRKEDSILVMSGCLSERYKEELQQELKDEVDIFTGVGDYEKIDKMLNEKQGIFSDHVYLIDHEERLITNSNYHAYIKLSEGCNQSCSFCAIPHFKGKLRSRPIETIMDEVQRLSAKGYYDFTFISQDSSSYLYDQGEREGLIKLIHAIEKIDGVESARILYLYPSTTSNELIDTIITSDTFHNYFDMPLQHISNRMLKKMKRGSGKKPILELLHKMRSAPDSFLRTGFIVGHPGESNEDFEELYHHIERFNFDRITVFAYSDEEDTLAYEMDDKVDEKTIEKRVSALEELIATKLQSSYDHEIHKEITLITEPTNSEHDELFVGAKKREWVPEIDGEILINESDVKLEIGKPYKAIVTQHLEGKLFAKVTAAL